MAYDVRMKRLSLYLMRHLVVATVLVTAALAMTIWMTQAMRLLDLVVDGGAPLQLFGTLMVVTLPTFLANVLPLSLLAAVLFTYHRLTVDSELVVMRAAGLGPWALARPALLLGLIVMLITYALTLYIAPAANRELVKLQRLARSNYSTVFLRAGVFNDLGDGVTVYVRERGRDGSLEGILIHDNRDPQRPVTVMAERGVLTEGEAGPRVAVFNGNRQEMDRETGQLSHLYFDRYAVDLTVFQSDLSARFPDPRERRLEELANPAAITSDPRLQRHMVAELHQRLAAPLLALAFPITGLAILFSGEFNRRGQSRRIAVAVVTGLVVQSAALGVGNLAANHTGVVPLQYAVPLVPILVGVWLMHRRPGRRRPGAVPAALPG